MYSRVFLFHKLRPVDNDIKSGEKREEEYIYLPITRPSPRISVES